MTVATFVIPTIGRKSLRMTLASIFGQLDNDWVIAVGCDLHGRDRSQRFIPWDRSPDEMHIPYWLPSNAGSAGGCRNDIIRQFDGDECVVSGPIGDWYCFVDDDDTISSTYVSDLRRHDNLNPEADVVIFRMDDPILGVLPPLGTEATELQRGQVGISFAVKREFWRYHEFRFRPEDRSDPDPFKWVHEDIDMIDQLRSKGANIVMAPEVNYYVKGASR